MNDDLKAEIAKVLKLCDRLSISGEAFRADKWRELRDRIVPRLLSALELAIEQRDACAHRNHALDASKRACELDEDNAAILAALRGEA